MPKRKEAVFQRYVWTPEETDLCRDSIETLDKIYEAQLLEDSNLGYAYWQTHWKPDLPEGVESIDEMDDYVSDLVDKAQEDWPKNKEIMNDLLIAVAEKMFPDYRQVEINGEPALQADGVNAVDSETPPTIYGAEYKYLIRFLGIDNGKNIYGDGTVVKPLRIFGVQEVETGREFKKKEIAELNQRLTNCRLIEK